MSRRVPAARARRHHRHPRRRPARPHAGAGRRAARLQVPHLRARGRQPGLRGRAAARPIAAYDDEAALDRFADAVDVVTYEFENVPARDRRPSSPRASRCCPTPQALAVAQDRLSEKSFVDEPRHRHRALPPVDDAGRPRPRRSPRSAGPAVLKTRRFGYDGKGQAMIRAGGRPRRGLCGDRAARR